MLKKIVSLVVAVAVAIIVVKPINAEALLLHPTNWYEPLLEKIYNTAYASEEVVIKEDCGAALPKIVLETIRDMKNANLLYSFDQIEEDGTITHHVVYIDGAKVAIEDPEIEWYGPLKLLAMFGEYDEETKTSTVASKEYTVKKGDTLNKVAKAFGTTTDKLMKLNPQIKNKNKIYPGQKINY